jgi:pimeloyl-ACP methyl ester carboxylesterase
MHSGRTPRFLSVGSGSDRRSIAYLTEPGNAPGIFWLQGFKSEMMSIKATALAEWTASHARAYTRFDYSGHGQSAGPFEDGTISRWLEETRIVFEQVTSGPQIVVGSSMGGYLALLLIRSLLAETGTGRPGRVAGLVMIAPAWDMTELMWRKSTREARRAIREDGVWYRPSQYSDEPYPITRDLIEDGRSHLLGTEPWNPGCPVEIIHGRLDPDVPFAHSEKLVEILTGSTVNLTEVPEGEHRLSRPQDLELLFEKIETVAP